MNYPPKYHQDNDINHMVEVIKTYPLATIISVKNNTPYITHLPLMLHEDNKLIGHIDKFNPHAKLLRDNNHVTIIFSGPQCYISPSIYTTNQLPTWNYIKVHLQGRVNTIDNAETIKDTMVKMTEFLEHPNHNYKLTIDNLKMENAINYVKGFKINIINWEGKFKLSQDKTPQDTANAKMQLIKKNQENIEVFLNNVLN